MTLKVYLSGEIHTDWRDRIVTGARDLDVVFAAPVTDHAASDDCGVAILGPEDNPVWNELVKRRSDRVIVLDALKIEQGFSGASSLVSRVQVGAAPQSPALRGQSPSHISPGSSLPSKSLSSPA